MKSFDTEIKKYAQKVSLKATERHELRERVLSYMEYHPLSKQATQSERRSKFVGIPADNFVTVHFNIHSIYTKIGAGVFALLIVATPFAAERSMPGDALYLVKTGITEPIQGQLASSPYEKIEFETKLMERRISEARTLASEGKLTPDVQTQIAETVKTHTEAVQTGLAELRTQDAQGAAIAEITFTNSLEVQSAVLTANDSTAGSSSINSILTVVNEAHEEIAANEEGEAPAFDSIMAKIEVETTRAYELFETIKTTATPEEVIDIERRLSDINRLIEESKANQSVDSTKATADLTMTLGLVQKLITFMADIDVREAVTLETLVPVVLSADERIDRIRESINTVTDAKVLIEQKLGQLTGTGRILKVEDGLATINDLLLKAVVAADAKDVAGGEAAMTEAQALVADIEKSLLHIDPGIEKPTTDEVPSDATTTPSEGEEIKKPE